MSPVRLGLTLPSFREHGEPLVAVARAAELTGQLLTFARKMPEPTWRLS